MTDKLKREFDKLEEIEVRYHQVLDVYRAHIHQDAVRKWQADEEAYQKVAAEWQEQMDKIRAIMDGNTTAEDEQHMDDLKEQIEDEFVPEEDQELELDHVVMQYKDLAQVVKAKGWCEKATPQQFNIFALAECKHNVTAEDVMEHAHTICKYSANVKLEEVVETLLQSLELKYIWVKTQRRR